MKKRTKKLSLDRETLRVEKFAARVVGGYMSTQCGHTDAGPVSECQLCGTYASACVPGWCHSVNGCQSHSPQAC